MGPIHLIPGFEVFAIDGGQLNWLRTKPTLREAVAWVQNSASRPSEYAIRCKTTGYEVSIGAVQCPIQGLRLCLRWHSPHTKPTKMAGETDL
jgi:hypothetical protein